MVYEEMGLGGRAFKLRPTRSEAQLHVQHGVRIPGRTPWGDRSHKESNATATTIAHDKQPAETHAAAPPAMSTHQHEERNQTAYA